VFERTPLNWAQLMRFKRTFTGPVPRQREQSYEKAGIVPIHGQAHFADKETLIAGGDRIRAKHFVLATGAMPQHVAEGDDRLLTSETFLELDALPASLLFIGGGYIAFEFAHVAARAGARVTILHNDADPLRGFDREVVEHLIAVSRDVGIDFQMETSVQAVERSATGISVRAQTKSGERRFEAENGVLAAGRVPELDALDLGRGGVERTKKGVKVNGYLQSVSNPNVYAAGDCADGGAIPLTPVASYGGELAAENILHGNTRTPDFTGLVSIVYTIPPLATVGMSQAQAREKGTEVDVHSADMSAWYATRHLAARAAFYKTVTEKGSGKIMGATVLGPHAEEQINVLALAVRQGLRREDIVAELFGYPTGSSDLEYMTGA
jgi:glutathione reductase (NADPH)